MKHIINKAIFASGYSVVRHTEHASILQLIKSLRPQDCGKPLIRIGGDGDGGYLIPDDLEGIEYCFSPGVSTVADFENHLADLGINCFLADYSVSAPPIDREQFTFDKRFLGSIVNDQYFTLPHWKNKYLEGYCADLILQMDIEGSEYQVLIGTPDHVLEQFRIMVIEFHYLHKMLDPFTFRLFEACFQKLSRLFYVAHLHPNNCCGSVRTGDVDIPRVLEFTFYNKKRVVSHSDVSIFPHPLDRDNSPRKERLSLPRLWYSD